MTGMAWHGLLYVMQQFDIMEDVPSAQQGRGGGGASKKKKEARDTKAKYEAKVMESRKQERLTYERKLQVRAPPPLDNPTSASADAGGWYVCNLRATWRST